MLAEIMMISFILILAIEFLFVIFENLRSLFGFFFGMFKKAKTLVNKRKLERSKAINHNNHFSNNNNDLQNPTSNNLNDNNSPDYDDFLNNRLPSQLPE